MSDTILAVGADGKFAGLVVPLTLRAILDREPRTLGTSFGELARRGANNEPQADPLGAEAIMPRALIALIEAQIETRCIRREETGEDLVGAVLFLASSDADFICGQTLDVDGGGHVP